MRCEIPRTRENETKTRTQSLNTSCSISTKTIPTASKPNAHKQTSACTLGVFEIESPRKAENAIRRRSKENIFVGLLLVGVLFCRESRFVLFCTGVLFSPSSVFTLSFYNFYAVYNREEYTEETKNRTTPLFARERQTDRAPRSLSVVR